ncbi:MULTISPECIES: hypothetical protein [Nocardia]|uniref:hypothetical protein n=1 Tax=Nocardia TaxID=1817 RepID=UPI0015EF5AE9|nr:MULTISPECIES: hypothetical protein [Nocardia]MCA2207333.1 hypothetical protein [Nocardia rosealba]
MAIYRTNRIMGSDKTPEQAVLGGDGRWRLTWLPEFGLTTDQAVSGLRLDEILSDPDLVYDRMALAEATTCADRIGIILELAMVRLWKRLNSAIALCGLFMARLA